MLGLEAPMVVGFTSAADTYRMAQVSPGCQVPPPAGAASADHMLLAYIPGLILARAEGSKRCGSKRPTTSPSKDLPEPDRFSRLLTARRHFVDTVKLIAYRAETSMASVLREKLSRPDDARSLLRQIYGTVVDLIPDLDAKTLTVRLPPLTPIPFT